MNRVHLVQAVGFDLGANVVLRRKPKDLGELVSRPKEAPDRPDLCFGTDPDHTPQWLCDLAVRTAERIGWRVAVNRPFGGAIVPLELYRSEARIHTIMIEVNRVLYMDETTGQRLRAFPQFRARLASLIRELAEATRA